MMANIVCRRRCFGRRRLPQLVLFSLISIILVSLFVTFLFLRSDIKDETIVSSDDMFALRNNKHQKEYIDKKGIHVIVGQYMGKGYPWESAPNLTQELMNENNYSPIPKMGENGLPVYVPEFESNRMKKLFHINRFNLLASDRISVNRSIPDPRKHSCRLKNYDLKALADTSIIIVFHNEAWSTLVRTVQSVINRSPHKLLNEIILVDDASNRKFLGKDLDSYMTKLSEEVRVPIRILRSQNRTGLIRARLLGADVAKGKVLTFLDAHCETAIGWLEPLLHIISKDRTRVVCPVIDIIHDQTFAYTRSFELHWGAFNWELHYRWFPIGKSEYTIHSPKSTDGTEPFKTPVMAGGLFSIDRQYFYEMGSYDSHMNIWGGENIEMSLRIWQCGGRIEISPCSHVAHLFRKSSPYDFGGKNVADVLYSNLARVAEVWLDKWKHFYYKLNPIAAKVIENDRKNKLLNITQRLQLRERLKCKGFQWFLDNVWPEHFFPTDDRFFGKIRNSYHMECLQRPSSKGGQPVGKVLLEKCALEVYGQQNFVYTKQGYLMSDESVCLDINQIKTESTVLLIACTESERQKWKYSTTHQTLRNLKLDLCLDINKNKVLTLESCSERSKTQKWEMIAIEWQ